MNNDKVEPEIRCEDIIRTIPTLPSLPLKGSVLSLVVEFDRRLEGRKSHFWKNMLPRLLSL